jgi:hypothetical protein
MVQPHRTWYREIGPPLAGFWLMAGLLAAQPKSYPDNGWPAFPALPVGQWVGQRIVFRPYEGAERLKRWEYGWLHREGSPATANAGYDEVAGKTAMIVAARTDTYPDLPTITIALDGTGARYVGHLDNGHLSGIAFLEEIARAKKELTGKRAWTLAGWIYYLQTYDAASQTFSGIPIKRFSPVTIVDAVVGPSSAAAPVRLVLRNDRGEEGYVAVVLSATNVMEDTVQDGRWRSYRFADLFSVSDPRKDHLWPKAVWDSLEEQRVTVGMNADQVRMAFYNPTSKAPGPTGKGLTENWTSPNGTKVHFERGLVTRIVDPPPVY